MGEGSNVSSRWRDNGGFAMPAILNSMFSVTFVFSPLKTLAVVEAGSHRAHRPGADWLVWYAGELL